MVKFRIVESMFEYTAGECVYARTQDEIRLWDRRKWAERVSEAVRTTTLDLPPENTTTQIGIPEGVKRAG